MGCETCQEAAEHGRRPEAHEPCASCEMFCLVGRRVLGVFVAPGEEAMCVATDAGAVVFYTSSECCSETWISDIVGVEALIGEVVFGVETLRMPQDSDGRSRQGSDTFYGIGLATMRGRTTVAYRNSSNGWYGGDMSSGTLLDAVPDGWKEVRGDFSA